MQRSNDTSSLSEEDKKEYEIEDNDKNYNEYRENESVEEEGKSNMKAVADEASKDGSDDYQASDKESSNENKIEAKTDTVPIRKETSTDEASKDISALDKETSNEIEAKTYTTPIPNETSEAPSQASDRELPNEKKLEDETAVPPNMNGISNASSGDTETSGKNIVDPDTKNDYKNTEEGKKDNDQHEGDSSKDSIQVSDKEYSELLESQSQKSTTSIAPESEDSYERNQDDSSSSYSIGVNSETEVNKKDNANVPSSPDNVASVKSPQKQESGRYNSKRHSSHHAPIVDNQLHVESLLSSKTESSDNPKKKHVHPRGRYASFTNVIVPTSKKLMEETLTPFEAGLQHLYSRYRCAQKIAGTCVTFSEISEKTSEMNFPEFIRLCTDFGIFHPKGLSRAELKALFMLYTSSEQRFSTINYDQFKRLMIRSAYELLDMPPWCERYQGVHMRVKALFYRMHLTENQRAERLRRMKGFRGFQNGDGKPEGHMNSSRRTVNCFDTEEVCDKDLGGKFINRKQDTNLDIISTLNTPGSPPTPNSIDDSNFKRKSVTTKTKGTEEVHSERIPTGDIRLKEKPLEVENEYTLKAETENYLAEQFGFSQIQKKEEHSFKSSWENIDDIKVDSIFEGNHNDTANLSEPAFEYNKSKQVSLHYRNNCIVGKNSNMQNKCSNKNTKAVRQHGYREHKPGPYSQPHEEKLPLNCRPDILRNSYRKNTNENRMKKPHLPPKKTKFQKATGNTTKSSKVQPSYKSRQFLQQLRSDRSQRKPKARSKISRAPKSWNSSTLVDDLYKKKCQNDSKHKNTMTRKKCHEQSYRGASYHPPRNHEYHSVERFPQQSKPKQPRHHYVAVGCNGKYYNKVHHYDHQQQQSSIEESCLRDYGCSEQGRYCYKDGHTKTVDTACHYQESRVNANLSTVHGLVPHRPQNYEHRKERKQYYDDYECRGKDFRNFDTVHTEPFHHHVHRTYYYENGGQHQPIY